MRIAMRIRIDRGGHEGDERSGNNVACRWHSQRIGRIRQSKQLRIAEEVSAILKPQVDPRPEIARINKAGKLQAEFWSPG